eukprot:NODE_177_length_14091_cov_0.996141.p10 type:complete len:123 gc:universal NODE_177_length_14091_cov_0.996141:11745-11377(-)
MREQYMRTGDGFLLVYSITQRSTFEETSSFHDQILRVVDLEYFPIVLVGNKCDMESERQVSTQEGKDLSKSWNSKFFESSAKLRTNVNECYYTLVREIRKFRHNDPDSDIKKKGRTKKCIIL